MATADSGTQIFAALDELGPVRRRREFWRRFARTPLAVPALAIIVLCIAVAVAAPTIAPYSPFLGTGARLHAPSQSHLLGTDYIGRDELSRLIWGSRVSLEVSLISVLAAIVAGVPLGLVAGYFGAGWDELIMRLMDAIIAFPALLLALAIIGTLGASERNVIIAIALTSLPVYARLIRAQALSLRELDFVTAARAMGAGHARVMLRHVLPSTLDPIVVQGSLGMGFAILAEAGLSFLGVGVKPPTPTWGGMLQDGFPYIRQSPWLSIFPGLAIFLLVLALNYVGDALTDTLNPRAARA